MTNLAQNGPEINAQPFLASVAAPFSKNDVSDISDAITAVLRAAGFENDHTRTILAALAEANGRTSEFPAYFASLGSRMKNKLDPFAQGEELERRGKMDAQRWRRALQNLEADQQATGFWFVRCTRGGSDRGGQVYPSRITVDVETFAETVRLARHREDFERNRKYAFEEAARSVLASKSKQTVRRLPREPMSEQDKLTRLEKTLVNSARRLAKIAAESGIELEELEALIFGKIRLAFYEEGYQNETTSQQDEVDTLLREEVSDSPDSPRVDLMSEKEQGPHGGQGEALAALQAFQEIGAMSFDVTLKNEETGQADYESFTAAELRAWLPHLLKRNEENPESLIIRPRGATVIQVDDCSPEVLARLRPFSFLTVETSLDNFQAWLALSPDTPEAELKEIRTRLLQELKPTGANGGAYGAVRCAGTINRKPERHGFRVRLRSVTPSRFVTTTELEGAGLLKSPLPAPPARQPEVRPNLKLGGRSIRTRAARSFPSYAVCLASKNGDRSAADASFLKLCQLRGFSESEAGEELERVSERAQEERRRGRRDYISRTWNFVSK